MTHGRTAFAGRSATWTKSALRDVRKLPDDVRRRVAAAVVRLVEGGEGDVESIKGASMVYRLRVGDWRVLFERIDEEDGAGTIEIQRAQHRSEAYR